MFSELPVAGPNVLPPLDEFTVRIVPVLLLDYLAAHGHHDAAPCWYNADYIEVTYRGFSLWNGALSVYRKNIDATMAAVREFLGYPA